MRLVIFGVLTLLTFLSASPNYPMSYNKEDVYNAASLYFERLTNYSNCKLKEHNYKREKVFELFGEDAAQCHHIFDLFNNENGENLNQYLFRISDSPYQSNIEIEFNKINVRDCVYQTSGGDRLVFVSAIKTLEFQGKKKSYPEVIAVNTSMQIQFDNIQTFPIYDVQFPSNIKTNCDFADLKENTQSQLNYFKVLGDASFNDKDFFLAKKNYEQCLLYDPGNQNIKNLIQDCQTNINYNSLLAEANRYFKTENYEEAKKLYSKIKSDYPSNEGIVASKISACKDKISEKNYSYYLQLANESFQIGFYDKAQSYYEKALQYKKNDIIALDMIRKCNVADRQKAQNEIERARRLVAEHKKKYFPEIIKTLSCYEASGLLEAKDYYNMAAILDVSYANVNEAMNYTNRQSFHLAKEYCLIAMKKGNASAEILWYDRFNNKSRNE